AEGPEVSIRMLGGVAGMAPYALHVDALDLRPPTGTPLTCRYQWDFGDPGSAFNTLEGWNAAHLYTKPGHYTVTLKLTDESGNVIHGTSILEIRPDQRRAVYVSADGDDSNDGATPATPLRTAGRAMVGLAGDTKILFRRGDVFPITSSLMISGRNVSLASYGNAPSTAPGDVAQDTRPRLLWSGARNDGRMVVAESGSANVVIQDLAFDSVFTHDTDVQGMPVAILPCGSLCTIDHCLFL